jgi:hypothetical protein
MCPPTGYVSELPSTASVSLATHPHQPSDTTKYYWSRPIRRPLQEQLRAFQIPESSWNNHVVVFSQAGYLPVVLLRPGHQFLQSLYHVSQFLQTRSASLMAFDLLWGQMLFASACRSSICMDSPSEAWYAIWQCISQLPGLSVLKAMTTKPLLGSRTTSRLGGFIRVRLSRSGEYSVSSTCWRIAKSWPCKWIWTNLVLLLAHYFRDNAYRVRGVYGLPFTVSKN